LGDSFAELIAPDILTPIQWYAGIRRENPRFNGTKQLMLAVLVDALQCLRNGAHGRTAIQRRSLAEADAWIADRKGQGPFAFETICETLGIDPDWLRENLREWRMQRLSGIDRQRQIRRLPVGRSERINASPSRWAAKRRKAKEPAAGQQGAPVVESEPKRTAGPPR
jgi:hypothetical protein